ncbi:MAG: molybdopterin-dependent oxidoreductase [Magnetococcales bacterium]|nr:molybdopterin-dependent oxidoreductase [Magnetococcales bacterium]
MDRRAFLKLGAASSAVAFSGAILSNRAKALPQPGGKDFSPATGAERQAVPSACWQCVTRCPIIGYVEDGRLVKIEGQPDSIRTRGVLCAKGQGGVNQSSDPDRILHPMKRVGKRGEGRWQRISWDEALGDLAARMKKLREAGEPEKVMFHYGRMKASSSKLIGLFFETYGTKTIGNHTAICEAAKWVGQELTWGVHYDNWDFDHARYVLNFGSNILEAHTNHVPTAHRLIDRLASGQLRLVTFDVRLSNTAAKSHEWLPIRPGTDRAAVLALCQVIMAEDLYQGDGAAFLKFCKATSDHQATLEDKVAALKAHLAAYTPEWAEGITGVAAATLRRLAREVATVKPACIISYRGAVAHHHGADTERAIQMLAAITGNIDAPGTRCVAVAPKWKSPTGPENKPKARELKIIDGLKGAAALPNHHVSHQIFKVIKDGSAGRPEVYIWYCHQPVYANGEVQDNIDILKDESLLPFTVCSTPFYDESAALADLILPDTPYTERWDWEDMVSPNQVAEFYIRQPLVPPMGATRDFADVCCDLADRLGMPLGFKSKEEFVRLSCALTPEIKAQGGFDFLRAKGVWHDPAAKPRYFSYRKPLKPEDCQRDGVIKDPTTGVWWDWKKAHVESAALALEVGYRATKKAYAAYVGQEIDGVVYAGFKPDKVNKSGLFELHSDLMTDKGFAPLPSWTPIPEHAAMAKDQLILITYKVAVQIHSRSQNCKYLTEIHHRNPAWINPATAQEKAIGDGDRIAVTSRFGRLETRARVTPAVAPGVIAISHHCGHWEYGRYASSKQAPDGVEDPDAARKWWRDNGAHPNWIIGNVADPISGQLRWMDTVVDVQRI